MEKFEQDAATRSALNTVAAFSNTAGVFGYQIGPSLQGVADFVPGGYAGGPLGTLKWLTRGMYKPGPGWVLQRQSFPAMLIVGMNRDDLKLKVQRVRIDGEVLAEKREVPDTFHLLADYEEGHSVVLSSSMANSQHIPGLIRGHEGTIIMVDHGMFERSTEFITVKPEVRTTRENGQPVRKGMFPEYKFGTEEQKNAWLPKIAAGEAMVGVMVTEPDYGSDVANIKTMATPTDGGYKINGVKTWATFAGRANTLMLLARTDPDRSQGHKGLSLFIVEKPEAPGHHFEFSQTDNPNGAGGRMEGRAIDTLGYRGMHSFEVAFEDWFVPAANLIGGEGGLGKGFYYQMEGFENGRLQTAARAVGLMQAAYEAALDYARDRRVFDKSIFEYQLTKAKIAKMAAVIQGGRQFAYSVARLMAKGEGALEASMVKAYVCRTAEWVTREALQIHGGMGYAEEFPVSRYFVDARVLSIFEGADETLCLRVIARRLAEQALEAQR